MNTPDSNTTRPGPAASYPQRGLWMSDRLEPNSAYNITAMERLKGPLSVGALQLALREVVTKHANLRSSFFENNGEPFQRIHDAIPVNLNISDFSNLSSTEQEDALSRVVEREVNTPFVLDTPPLFRFHLVRFSLDHHVFIRTIHHIVFDAWSNGLFARDLSRFYSNFLSEPGRAENSLPRPLSRSDTTSFQVNDRRLDFWRTLLRDAPEKIEWPPLTTCKAVDVQAGTYNLEISCEDAARLTQFCQLHHLTPFMVMLAAFFILLSRHSGREELLIGTPVSDRPTPEHEQSIGFFTNIVLLRQRLRDENTIRELLAEIRRSVVEAIANNLPLELLIEQSVVRPGGRKTSCQVVFGLQNTPLGISSLEGLSVENLDVRAMPSVVRYELEVQASLRANDLRACWRYDRRLFEDSFIQQLAESYKRLVSHVLSDVDQQVGSLDCLSAQELMQVSSWGEGSPLPQADLVLEKIKGISNQVPSSTAIVCGREVINYRDMMHRVRHLGGHLTSVGVRPGDAVAVALDRSIAAVIATLAIWEAGAIYLPIDTGLPTTRVQSIIGQVNPRFLITTGSPASSLGDIPRHIVLDELAMPSAAGTDDSSRSAFCETAYLIFTSGSSGEPKGVVVEHASLSAFIAGFSRTFPLHPGDVHVGVAATSFDISILDFVLPLCRGATALVATPEQVSDPLKLSAVLAQWKATSMQATPTFWKNFCDIAGADALARLHILIGGESLPRDLAQRLLVSSQTVWNLYGPTEATIWASAHQLQAVDVRDDAPAIVSIGRPLPGYRVCILDEKLRYVPPQVPAELYISGPLARGYLGRVGEVSGHFVNIEGKRFFRTGDLARWNTDGTVAFLGRRDRQVKIHGFRIELEEVEAVLRQHKEVRDAVAAITDDGNSSQLVAYVLRDHTAEENLAMLAGWQKTWDEVYRHADPTSEPSFIGWTSSYTQKPIRDCEMQEWLDETVRQILLLGPTDILEIGCGSGLLASRVASVCTSYLGLDFSPTAVDQARRRQGRSHMSFKQARADEIGFVESESRNLVILNSVIQYFPNHDYLTLVLDEAVRVTREGGHIFIGDVRDLSLLEAFHSSIEMQHGGNQTRSSALQERIARAMAAEKELFVRPDFFQEFARRSPRVSDAVILPKLGLYDNELTRFRYDIAIGIGEKMVLRPPSKTLVWDGGGRWCEEARRVLARETELSVEIRDIPVAKVLRFLDTSPSGLEGEDLRRVRALAVDCGVSIRWLFSRQPGHYHAVLRPKLAHQEVRLEEQNSSPREPLSNMPAVTVNHNDLENRLRDHARKHLPHYMVPIRIQALDSWPLTPSGKIDYTALPRRDSAVHRKVANAERAPRIAERLCQIISELLGVPNVSSADNFFDLGGDSLAATRLISQLGESADRLTLRHIFDAETIGGLAALIHPSFEQEKERSNAPSPTVARH